MKKSKDGKEIPSRIWYYLLDWNDYNNWEAIHKMFGTIKLHELTANQIIYLFKFASQSE